LASVSADTECLRHANVAKGLKRPRLDAFWLVKYVSRPLVATASTLCTHCNHIYLLSSSEILCFQNARKCFWAPASLICRAETYSQWTKTSISTTTTRSEKKGSSRKTHLLDLRRRQLKCHGTQVVAEPLLFAGRCDRHDVLVDAPAQADLASVDGVFLRQLSEDVVHGSTGCFGHRCLWPVGGEGDALRTCVSSCCVARVAYLTKRLL